MRTRPSLNVSSGFLSQQANLTTGNLPASLGFSSGTFWRYLDGGLSRYAMLMKEVRYH